MNSRRLYEQVGARIKSRRKKLEWTQEHLAGRVGISRASLANIETGRQSVLLHHLYRLAETLQLDVTALLPALTESRVKGAEEDLPLPENLKPGQKAQIARALLGEGAMPAHSEDERHVHITKARS